MARRRGGTKGEEDGARRSCRICENVMSRIYRHAAENKNENEERKRVRRRKKRRWRRSRMTKTEKSRRKRERKMKKRGRGQLKSIIRERVGLREDGENEQTKRKRLL